MKIGEGLPNCGSGSAWPLTMTGSYVQYRTLVRHLSAYGISAGIQRNISLVRAGFWFAKLWWWWNTFSPRSRASLAINGDRGNTTKIGAEGVLSCGVDVDLDQPALPAPGVDLPYCTDIQSAMYDEFAQECLCGSRRFERVIVERRPSSPIVTDFIACLSCKTMLYLPPVPVDSDDALRRDAAIAARDYRKPGHRKR